MYNWGLRVDILDGASKVYEGVVVKVKADTITAAKTQVATMFGVQASAVSITSISYVQEILHSEEE